MVRGRGARSLFRKLLERSLPGGLDYLRTVTPLGWGYRSFSQEGEDMILRRYFDSRRTGYFVDIGAHHPKKFSNTYFLYRRGWKGINVDAMPGAMSRFDRYRRRDKNIHAGIGEAEGELTYFMFNEPALNGFSEELTEERTVEDSPYRVIGTVKVQVERLESLLDRELPEGQSIDFLSVDVEGWDLSVLRSNNWQRFRPRLVLAEALGSSLDDLSVDPISRFMQSVGYRVFAKCFHTVFYEDTRNRRESDTGVIKN